ncbi:hypothetical protein ABTY98_38040 [Streptomyces sp. NPDC096040]|uniref:hypothetical protein n=1 Tax=Streptomyces sp. NPDC096040 TaxID=3155541 RepID=UPI003332A4B3
MVKTKAPATSPSTRKAPAPIPGCRNLAVSSEVNASVTRAYRRGFPLFVHIEPVPHRFFYGECGAVRYASAQFRATTGATQGELVNMQDEGSAAKYFRADSGADWIYIASDSYPASPHGCGDIPQIPRALAAAWGNCAVAH